MQRSKDGDVHLLVLGAGENTFDLDFLAEMNRHLDAVEQDSEGPCALVLTGEGKFFSNGLNLSFLMGAEEEQRRQFGASMIETMRRLILFPVPTVAAINGHAFAAGAFLALACDYRIQREDRGWICISEVDAGVPIGDPMMGLLRAKVPAATAREAVLTGRRYDAGAAVAAGFADARAPAADLVAAATRLAAPVAQKQRRIFRTLKATLNGPVAEAFQTPG